MTATDNSHFPSSIFITCSSGKTSHFNPAADGAINAIKNSKSSRTSTKNHYHLPTTHGRTQFGLNADRFQCHSQNWLPSYVSFFIFPIFLKFLCLPKFPIIYTTQSRLYAIYPSVDAQHSIQRFRSCSRIYSIFHTQLNYIQIFFNFDRIIQRLWKIPTKTSMYIANADITERHFQVFPAVFDNFPQLFGFYSPIFLISFVFIFILFKF